MTDTAEKRAEPTPTPTPGPWNVIPGDSKLTIEAAGTAIASVGTVGYWEKFSPKDEANAHLIAAAPDTAAERDRLRAALQQAEEGAAIIVGQISAPQDGLSPETTAWVVKQAMAISNRARAALKAHGPAPEEGE